MQKNKSLTVIGSKIFVSFPGEGIKNVPAKIDTGADSSSIWASNIKEKNGTLSFILFGPGSAFYNGKIISTKHYQSRTVLSSFGERQFRYKIYLKIKIKNKNINASFYLADRSASRFPILIGRRTLRSKFLVDVARAKTKKKYNILVIDKKPIKSVKRFFENITQDNPKLKFTLITPQDLAFKINNNFSKIEISNSKKDVIDFDLAFFKAVMMDEPAVVALAKHFEQNNVPFFDKANLFIPMADNKLAQYIALQSKGIPVPKSIFMDNENMQRNYTEIKDFLGSPFVLKDILASNGHDNYLISSSREFKTILNKAQGKSLHMIAQEYIENDGDYRILIFGKRVRLVIYRCGSGKSHLNSTSQGGTVKLVEENTLPGYVRKMCLDAAKLLNFDIAGIDMVQDKNNGSWYCLEVNHAPQIATAPPVDAKREKFAEFLEKWLSKGM